MSAVACSGHVRKPIEVEVDGRADLPVELKGKFGADGELLSMELRVFGQVVKVPHDVDAKWMEEWLCEELERTA